MQYVMPLTAAVFALCSLGAQAESNSALVSFIASPYAAMNADVDRETRFWQTPAQESDKFNMTLGQGYGARLSAWHIYVSYTESITDADSEIPDAHFKTFTAGFIDEAIDDNAYPTGLYLRWGMGLGQGELRYAYSNQNEDAMLAEAFVEGGLTFVHRFQLGLQLNTQSLFDLGDTRATLVGIAMVGSVHF